MRVFKVELNGIRRFSSATRLVVDGKLTALIGPNEAGKTTVLESLELIAEPDVLLDSARSQSLLSRSRDVDESEPIVEASFTLDEADREALSAIDGSELLRVFRVGVSADGDRTFAVEPSPRRDRRRRRSVVKQIQKVQRSPWFSTLNERLQDEITAAEFLWDVEDESLAESSFEGTDDLIDSLLASVGKDTPQYISGLPDQIRRFVDYEQLAHPKDLAAEALWNRSPDFVLFKEADRNLQSSYALQPVSTDTPPALENLARLAELDLQALASAYSSGNQGLVDTISEDANDRLQGLFADVWNQSQISVRFRVDGGALRIAVKSKGEGYYGIDERSAGLRTFVALAAFVSVRSATEPILLIDEVETHLHYDAQADLIQMLQQQVIAPQVIYTTHSAGALPEDLAAVRSIAPVDGLERSETRNWFWTDVEPGFLSLLLRMGASTMAFLPTRNAVVVEGPSDMLLLPAILKDAVDVETLGFQSVPGLAGASDAKLRILDHVGSSVVFVTDADAAGKRLTQRLKDQGVRRERILKVSEREGWSIEDLLDEDIYIRAVNDVLQVATSHRLAAGDLTTPGRCRSIELWCDRLSLSAPSKRAVAQAVRAIRHEEGLSVVSDEAVDDARQLYEAIGNQLDHMAEG